MIVVISCEGWISTQEEIRFVICPELIVGMLICPAMRADESIQIVGAERYSKYTGWASPPNPKTLKFPKTPLNSQSPEIPKPSKPPES